MSKYLTVLFMTASAFRFSAHAQMLPPPGTSTVVTVQPAATAAEQLQLAKTLAMTIADQTDPRKRFEVIAETFANLNAVAATWPNDTHAVVDAALIAGETGLAWDVVQKTIDVLSGVLPLVRGQTSEVRVERMLGQAYQRANRPADAEQRLLSAERALASVKADRVEAEAVLDTLANLYARRGQPHDAVRRFHELINLSGEDDVNKAAYALASLKQVIKFPDDANHGLAIQEYALVEQFIRHARGTNLSPADARTINNVEQDAELLRQASGF
jgi:tetratricopeptide (TPR) repeat protein